MGTFATFYLYTRPMALPMLYSGQEAGLNKRLKFFAKDTTIDWSDPQQLQPFYQQVEPTSPGTTLRLGRKLRQSACKNQ